MILHGDQQMSKTKLLLHGFQLIVLWTILHGNQDVTALTPGGVHVCARSITYNTYYVRTLTRIGYDNYRTCCKRFLRACTSRCTRYRSKTVSYTKAELRIRSKMQYYCCPGWAPQGNTCPLAICNPGCKNGRCYAPNKCQCNKGFNGKLCETDINECTTLNPCQQACRNLPGTYACSCNKGYVKELANNAQDGRCKDVNECTTIKPCRCASNVGGCAATCTNTAGSFKCACRFGYQLAFDQKTCIDVNECAFPAINKCQHNCINRPGSFMCTCGTGYLLAADKRSCTDVNECLNLNGGCNQICTNKPGTFQCSCKSGYRMQANKRTCLDVDECKEKNPCDRANGVCRNIPASFQCACKTGYALQSDKKTCKDINECSSKTTNGCTQNCHNSLGSYTCTCNTGYRLNINKRSCDDVNECTANTHQCQHTCLNNVGSYTCACKQGYKLHTDGRTCIALPCQKLSKPFNGQISCTGYVTGMSCTFACDIGYELGSSSKRTCQPTSTWSGNPAKCNKKSCPELLPPRYGSLMIPCVQLYGSKCNAKCNQGYYLTGAENSKCVVNNGKTKWFPNNATCIAAMPCTPNPCRHAGNCKEKSTKLFTCDCENTGYIGETCNVGVISVPSFPQLFVNVESETLRMFAYPEEILEIRPRYNAANLKFTPDKLVIYPTTREVQFTVKTLKIGVFPVDFEVIGVNANQFIKPKQVLVYSYQKINLQPVDIATGFNANNCKERTITQCKKDFKLKSSCAWSSSTNGFVSIQNDKLDLPVSVLGLSTTSVNTLRIKNILVPTDRTREFVNKRQLINVCADKSKCNSLNVDSNMVNFILNNNLFPREYVNKANTLLPHWLNIKLNMLQKYFAEENFQSILGKSSIVRDIKSCNNIKLNQNDFYSFYLPKISLQLQFLSSTQTTSSIDKSLCMAINLCKNSLAVGLNTDDYINLNKQLSNFKLDNLKISIKSFTYGEQYSKCTDRQCYDFNSSWNVSSSIVLNSKSSSLSFEGVVYANLDEQVAVEKFTRERILLFNGAIDYKFSLRMFGSTFIFKGEAKDGTMYARLGGPNATPICHDKGLNLKLRHKIIDQTSAQVTFKPTDDLKVYLPYDIQGGMVTSIKIDVKNKLAFQIGFINRLVPTKINDLKSALSANGNFKDVQIVTKYFDLFNKELKKLDSLIKVYHKNQFTLAYEQLDFVKESSYNLNSHLQDIQNRLRANARVYLTSKIISSQLKLFHTMNITPNDQILTQHQQGKIISYKGSICIYNLCFNNVNVKIYDLAENANQKCKDKYVKYVSKDTIIITITSVYDQNLSPRIKIKQGEEMTFAVSRYKNIINGEIFADIKIANDFYKSKLKIVDLNVELKSNDVRLLADSEFNIKSSSKLLEATWQSVVNKIEGQSSDMAAKLLHSSSNLYINISLKNEDRLQGSNARVNFATQNLASGKKNFTKIEADLKNSVKQLLIKEASYRRNIVQQQNNQTTFDSYLKTLDPLFIKQNVEKVCMFDKCKETCIPMPVCDICQDPLKIDVTTLKCVQSKETIRRNIQKQFNTDCEVKQYLFIPYYTGSCKPNPNEQGKSDAKLKESLIATGTAVGSLIGSVVPVLGTAIGAAIGAAVGWVASLFSSCDRSMEVYQKSWFQKEACTLLVPGVETTIRPVSKCDKHPIEVQTGFKAPYTCNCKMNDCLAKAQDQICLLKNVNCEKNRKLFLERTSTIPSKFTDLYKSMSLCNEKIATSLLQIQTAKKMVEFKQREFKRIKNLVISLEEELKITKQSFSDAASILKDDVCVMNKYKTSKDLSKILQIKDVKFSTRLPLIGNILLNIHVTYQNKSIIVPFVYDIQNDLEDIDMSMKALSQKIIKSILCKSTRRRRSLDHVVSKVNDNLSFEPWYIDANATASVARLSCVTLKRTLEFLSSTVKKLNTKSHNANELKMQLQYSTGKINQAMSLSFPVNTFGYSESNDLIRANQDLLMSANNQLSAVNEQVTPTNVLNIWKNEAEIFTGFNNMTVCLSYNDCIDKAIITLKELPTIASLPRALYLKEIAKLDTMFKNIFEQTNLIDLLSMSKSITGLISHIESISLHCSNAPTVSIYQDVDEILEEGLKVNLRCSAQSDLPVKYFWKYNDGILDDETRAVLTVNINQATLGMYTCIATNLAGNGTSKGKSITYFRKPKFIEEPSDITFVLPSPKDIEIQLPCNVTAMPTANITWIYKTDSKVTLLVKERLPLLRIKNPTLENSGLYQCIATNKYGSIQSKLVKVQILPAALASSKFTVSFDVLTRTPLTVSSFKEVTTEMLNEVKGYNSKLETKILNNAELTTVSFNLLVSAFTKANPTYDEMLSESSKIRQGMANSAAAVIKTILLKGSKIPVNNGELVSVDNDTISYGFKLNICQQGYKIHKNGFMCVKCTYGSAGYECRTCPMNTYADQLGQVQCTKCNADEITQTSGSTKKTDCFKTSNRKTDIIFLIDSSKTFLQKSQDVDNVKNFIKDFTKSFINKSNTRFALVTYYKYVDVYLELNEYEDRDQLVALLDLLDSGTHTKDTSLALREAREMFKRHSDKLTKKVVVVITNGFSKTIFSVEDHAFIRTRQNAIKLQQDGVHVVSIGVGKLDVAELRAISSYPKIINTILPKTLTESVPTTIKSIDNFLQDQHSKLSIDIGILYRARKSRTDAQFKEDKWKQASLLLKIYKAFSYDSFMFMSSHRPSINYGFESFNEKGWRIQINAYYQQMPFQFDAYKRIQDATYLDFTELHRSYSKLKSLVVITENPLEEKTVKHLQKTYYNENIVIVNFAMNDETIERTESPLSTLPKKNRVIFAFSEADMFIERLKKMQGLTVY